MATAREYNGQTVAVLGLGKSGLATARALMAGGAIVHAWDDGEAARERAAAEGVAVVDLTAADWSRYAALVPAPGVPLTFPRPHPVVAAARAAGVDILGDVELLWRAAPDARYIAVTGTNGKSTTTALIGHLLTRLAQDGDGFPVAVGGNLGTPALDLPELGENGVYVLELSSYQIDLLSSLSASVALLLNITPDHIDRHGDFEGYIAAKRRLFALQRPGATAVVGVDDGVTAEIFDELAEAGRHRAIPIAAGRAISGGVYADADGWLVDDTNGGAEQVIDLRPLATLRGRHNWQNAAAAVAAIRALGFEAAAIARHLASFPGLPHRMEQVGCADGLLFVNDSKATNADAAARALDSFDRIYWIAGGRAKEGGIETLAPWFDRIRHAFLIGEAANDFAATLSGKVPSTLSRTLDRAVADALAAARADRDEGAQGDAVVLLSPACASFDQFPNFEIRGEAFRDAVRASLEGGGEGAR